MAAQNLKELFKDDLTREELAEVPTSFDVVGDILIFSDYPRMLIKKEKMIGNRILGNFKNIKAVCKKTRKYSGIFRTPRLKIMAGEKRKETIHKENHILIKLDVEKVYFSARLGHERERINRLVRPREKVLVMFSGSGVYCINISKNSAAEKIYGVEINPIAHKYALENAKLNKADNVQSFLGDVKSVLPKIKGKFDRILMPLPKSAEDFIPAALSKLKRGGMLHFYDFVHETEFEESRNKLLLACKKEKRKASITDFVKCGQYGPGKFRVCIDARVS